MYRYVTISECFFLYLNIFRWDDYLSKVISSIKSYEANCLDLVIESIFW